MTEKKLDEILDLIKTIDTKQDKMEERLVQIEKMRIEDNKRIEEQFNKIEKKFEQIDENRIHDNFYFEQHYGEKITAIFDKIQLEEQLKEMDKEENKKLEKQVELNSAKIMLHESRISKLEKSANF